MLTKNDKARRRLRLGIILSSACHCLLLVACALLFRGPLSMQLVAAGEGQGGGQGGVIEVGVVDAGQLGFTKPRAISHIGEEVGEANNTMVETRRPAAPPDAEVLPAPKNKPPKATEKTTATERPTASQTEQLFSKKPLRGRSADTNVEVGRSYGSPTPAMSGGVGVGTGGGAGFGSGGVPGGSEYGRRIQMILSRNYNPPTLSEVSGTHYVIIQLRVARDGRILSLAGTHVDPRYIKQPGPNGLITNAAVRAIIASNPLPPFPNGFLMGTQEAVAEIWFRYPK